MKVRLVRTDIGSAYLNLALEEAIFRLQDGLTARVWKNKRSVIIGRGQLAAYETDLDYCSRNGIPVVRRFTGGGAVYNGPGNVNWSVFVRRGFEDTWFNFAFDARRALEIGSSIIKEVLAKNDVASRSEGSNRIITAEGKVSGISAYVSKDGFVCHGTMLLQADLNEARELTSPRETELPRRYVRSKRMKLANTGISENTFFSSIRALMVEKIGSDLNFVTPDKKETLLARKLLREKYEKEAWNLGDPFGSGAVDNG